MRHNHCYVCTNPRPLLNCFDQSDESLVDIVRKVSLLQPDWSRPYNLSKALGDVLQDLAGDSANLAEEMDTVFFKGKLRNGFFIEAGASDGETDSHTLYFESKYNWTGLLVEPAINALRFKNRKATSVYNCLAIKTEPHYAQFDMTSALNSVSAMGGIVQVVTLPVAIGLNQS